MDKRECTRGTSSARGFRGRTEDKGGGRIKKGSVVGTQEVSGWWSRHPGGLCFQTLLRLNAHRSVGLIVTQEIKKLVETPRTGCNVSEICLLGDELVVELLRLNFPTHTHLLPNVSIPVSVRAKKQFSTEGMGPDRERVWTRDRTPDDVGLGVPHPTTLVIDHECGRTADSR